MEWTVEFLDDRVEAEFAALPVDFQASILRVADLIRKYGLEHVGMPYVRHVQGKIWEMRGRGHDGIARSLYVTAKGRRVIILRSFVKKTQRTPGDEVLIARKGKGGTIMGRNAFDYHNEKMRGNAEYKAAYDALEPEFSIADALIRARVEAGFTQAEVAARLGVTQPAVARMESGRNISLKSVARYAGAIGRPITLEIMPKPL